MTGADDSFMFAGDAQQGVMRSEIVTIRCWASCLMIAMMCSGCATIMGQSSYDIQIDSSEPDTKVEIMEHGRFVGSVTTPATVKLKSAGEWSFFSGRQGAAYSFMFSKEGYEPHIEYRNGTLNWWYLGNGLVGMIVDIRTGALYKLDDSPIYAKMEKEFLFCTTLFVTEFGK